MTSNVEEEMQEVVVGEMQEGEKNKEPRLQWITVAAEKPHGVQVVKTGPEHTFILDEDALHDLLLREEICHLPVVVVSVVGPFRKGKSFLLALFIKYLNHKYGSGGGDGDWLGPENEPLQGFSWRGGSQRDTTGILMWSEIYTAKLDTGEKVAIILLDTQGTFDSESTVRENAIVASVSTLLSSHQIYNLSQNIQEDNLQHLQLFTEYGRLALEDSGRTPFQRLKFLVRDWSFPYDKPYGAQGGQDLLQSKLKFSDDQHQELQSLRKHIRSCFADITCFLLPHPGLCVATNPSFDGRLSDIDPEFKRLVRELVNMVLAPQNLVPKLIHGQKVKCKEFLQYFKSYMKIYKENQLPEPRSMFMATAEANNLAAVAEAKEVYMTLMEEVCGGAKPYLQSQLLEAEHKLAGEKALHAFHGKKKMGGQQFSQDYCEQLTQDLQDTFTHFRAHNESKNIFNAARTPSVFFAIAMFFYTLSGILGLVGLDTLADLANLAMGLALLILVLWAYIRYSGRMRGMGIKIDKIADVLWDGMMKPMYLKGVKRAAATAAKRALSAPKGQRKAL